MVVDQAAAKLDLEHRVDGTPSHTETWYNVKASIVQIKRWPDIKQGYFGLFAYIGFVLLFVAILALQTNVPRSYEIDSSLREGVVRQSLGLDLVRTQRQFWKYLLGTVPTEEAEPDPNDPCAACSSGDDEEEQQADEELGLIRLILRLESYSGESLTPAQQGFVSQQNKLVGGVQISQYRVKPKDCDNSALYGRFYTTCLSEEQDKSPFGPSTAPNKYTFDMNEGRHTVFLPVSQGAALAYNITQQLKADLFTDKHTRLVQIKFATYNGLAGVFTHVDIKVRFEESGILFQPHIVGIRSLDLELYSNSSLDTLRLSLELIFLFIIGYQIGSELLEVYTAIREDSLPEYLSDLWNVLDWTNITLFMLSTIWRVQFIYLAIKHAPQVPSNRYNRTIEEAAALSNVQITINSFNVLICMFRMFKFYEFQDRLNILTRTFIRAWTDLYHFMFMFMIVFIGYSFLGYLLFGSALYNYSTLGNAIQAQWEMMLANYDYQSMYRLNPPLASVYFWTYIFLVSIVMLNVLLAILIDAYTASVVPEDKLVPFSSVGDELSMAFKRGWAAMQRWRGLHKTLSDEQLVEVLEHFKREGVFAVTRDDLLARLDSGMAEQLERKLPVLREADEIVHQEMNPIKRQFLRKSSQLLRENARLKEQLIILLEEEATRREAKKFTRKARRRAEQGTGGAGNTVAGSSSSDSGGSKGSK